MKVGLPVPLDRTKPFVRAVCASFESADQIKDAASILQRAEQKHGASVWCELSSKSELGAGFFVPKPEVQRISLPQIMDLIKDWKEFTEYYITDWDDVVPSPQLNYDQLIEESLFPFLSETHLILNGSHFMNDHFVLFENGAISAWTSRAWGALMAEWANEVDWGPHYNKRGDKYKWNYVSFYIGLNNETFENYYQWEDTVFKVIRIKTEEASNR